MLRGSQFSDSAVTNMQRITPAPKRSRAMNYRCCCAIVLSEKTHTLAGNKWKLRMRHRAVRKDTHAGRQRMQSADAPSCGQKQHTRWPATSGNCGCAIVRSEKTHTLAATLAGNPYIFVPSAMNPKCIGVSQACTSVSNLTDAAAMTNISVYPLMSICLSVHSILSMHTYVNIYIYIHLPVVLSLDL